MMQLGEGEEEEGGLEEGVSYVTLEEEQVAEGYLGPYVRLRYVVLVKVHQEGNRRLSVQRGWSGPGQEVEAES